MKSEPLYVGYSRKKDDKESAMRQLKKLRTAFIVWLLSAIAFIVWCCLFS